MTTAAAAEPDIATVPDVNGHWPANDILYGGSFAPESLTAALDDLAKAYEQARKDPAYIAQLKDLLKNYAGRPTLLYRADRFSERTWRTPARTRSTTCSARRCSRSGWARPG
jgi:hypothetical protein